MCVKFVVFMMLGRKSKNGDQRQVQSNLDAGGDRLGEQ
jgi:hypothetical protein